MTSSEVRFSSRFWAILLAGIVAIAAFAAVIASANLGNGNKALGKDSASVAPAAQGQSAGSNTASVQWLPAIVQLPEERGLGSWLVGSGFEPGQELGVQIMMAFRGGSEFKVPSDIYWLMDPVPVPDDDGAFAAAFEIRPRYWERGLLQAEAVTARLVDRATGETVTTAPLVLCDLTKADDPATEEIEEQDPWCMAAQPGAPVP